MSSTTSPVRQSSFSITTLADQTFKLLASIISYLNANGHAQPHFTAASAELPETSEYEALRNQFNDTVLDLHRLVNGPKNILRTQGYSFGDHAAIQIALSRKYFELVPVDVVGLTAAELAKKAGMDEDRTSRILKVLATQRIFEEVHRSFRHTAASNFLRTSLFTGMSDVSYHELFKAASEMNTHIDASPYSTGLENCAFYNKYGTTFYGYLEANPERAAVFSKAMSGWSLVDDSLKVLRNNFGWSSLENTKVVDIGGGNGHIRIDLAQHYPALQFTVQDISNHQLSSAQSAEVQDRVTFQQYDYTMPQPIRDAGVYLFRIAFHNNNDEEAMRMLRAVVPALENRHDDPILLINDGIVPERAEGTITRSEEHQHRQLDMVMLLNFGGKERMERDWRALFEKVDKRLEISRMCYSPRGAGLLEIRLRQQASRVSKSSELDDGQTRHQESKL
ncbi:S-adenosyl-L-methionine-dependent methyltransferase [Decorospora gaudefroyi]|uniref:S-adenosyl-L-methionine-dependent methyltransferase n=1 Tax=Decorospora gaudefroyi TaxID=184978 RepID=A0A6A5JXH5_9PLEO|nr:S-adenosyl-L-methionine-dependent methyltransferase [Decorospora gaudefroyi]